MIEVTGLVKDFGSLRAVDGVSFSVPKGQVLGFLGPNGAGKSTTMKMLTCFLPPTSGTARLNGFDICTQSLGVRASIGYLPESAPSYGEMTPREFLSFVAEMRSLRGSEVGRAIDRVRELCHLGAVWEQPIETLSKGFRQRVGFAQALIHNPPVLILDEPTDGLDPNQKHEVRQIIRSMATDKTIILSTHILEEVEAICQRVIIVAAGKIVSDATPRDLMRRSKFHNAVTIAFGPGSTASAKAILDGHAEIARVEPLADRPQALRVFPRNQAPLIRTLSHLAREHNWQVDEMQVDPGRLDEVFRAVTAGNNSSGAERSQ